MVFGDDAWILGLGLFFTVFGGLVLFSDRFLKALKNTLWRDGEYAKRNIPARYRYLEDRYVSGLSTFLLGLVFLCSYAAVKLWA
jgi:hypothetical protein